MIAQGHTEGHETCPVAVVIPCYRCASTLDRAVRSVLAQSCLPREVWLVDDASDDDGRTGRAIAELVERFADRLAIHSLSLPENRGPGSARNLAWEATEQDFVAFLDADDAWHPKKLALQYAWMAGHRDVVLSGHRSIRCDVLEDITGPVPERLESFDVGLHGLIFRNLFQTRTVMVRRDVPHRFPEGRRYSEDYLLWLRLVGDGGGAVFLDAVLACSFKADFGDHGLTAGLWAMEKGELENYRILLEEGRLGRLAWGAATLFSILKFAARGGRVAVRRAFRL